MIVLTINIGKAFFRLVYLYRLLFNNYKLFFIKITAITISFEIAKHKVITQTLIMCGVFSLS